MKTRSFLVLLAFALLLGPSMAQAQDTGRIDGRVSRDDGSGVGGVTVVIDGLDEATITGANGTFAFAAVPAGTYTVIFTSGESTESQAGVEVRAGETTTVDLTVDWDVRFLESITVFSASRREERITEAPAAVTVIPEAQIQREAAHGQLPKLLEFTPGAEVTQSGVYDYNFNTRGFNSSLNRRVATLIDGRDPSVPFLGAQEWAAISFPLDDISSLELIRGPSAALYGANASSGVLNMTTKQPRYSQGGQIRIAAGELSTTNADLRWAADLGNDTYLKVLGGIRNSGDFSVSRRGAAEYSQPCLASGQTNCLPQEAVGLDPVDDNEIWFGGVRLDKYVGNGNLLSFEGGYADVSGPVFQTGIGRVQLVDVERPWARVNFNTNHWNVLAYYNGREASRQTALSTGNNLTLDTENYKLEVQGNYDLFGGRGRVVFGASYEEEDIDSFDPNTGRQTLVFEPISSDAQALFAQFDYELTDSLKLVVAGRFDDSTLHEEQFSPKGSLVWGINENHTMRLTYNEAFQVANYSEFFLQAQVGAFPGAPLNGVCSLFGINCGFPALVPVLAAGNADLDVEEVKTAEIGYSGIFGNSTFLTVDYYRGENENFITDLLPQLGTSLGRTNPNFGLLDGVPGILGLTLDGVVGMFIPGAAVTNNLDGSPIIVAVSYTNFGQVDTEGLDIGLNHYFNSRWHLAFSYSWFDFEIQNNLPGFDNLLVPNTPENKATIGFFYVGDRFDLGASLRWSDEFAWAVGPFVGIVEDYYTIDLNTNYAINDQWKVGVNIANLSDNEHWESFGGDLIGRRALGHVVFEW